MSERPTTDDLKRRLKGEPDLCGPFVKIAEYAMAIGEAPINRQPGCWEKQVDERWWLAVNPHKEPHRTLTTPRGGMENPNGDEVPPFTALVFFNGWPAGLLDPYGGVLAAGEGANERTFVAALKAAAASPGETASPTASSKVSPGVSDK